VIIIQQGNENMTLDGVMLYVPDVPATVRFYETAFGLKLRFMDDEKKYAQMDTGAATLAFADESVAPSLGLILSPNRATNDAPAIQLPFMTDDVEAAFARVVAAGGVVVNAPTSRPWGQTLGHVRDNNGVLIEISTTQEETWHDEQERTDR